MEENVDGSYGEDACYVGLERRHLMECTKECFQEYIWLNEARSLKKEGIKRMEIFWMYKAF